MKNVFVVLLQKTSAMVDWQRFTRKQKQLRKLEGTPEHAFLFNDEVNGVKCPSKLDEQWYIDLANQRLKDFGVM